MTDFKRLEFHLTYTCPQACVFCSEEERMDAFKDHPVTLEQAARVLADKRREGFDHVTFTGGEPTIFPHFDKLLRFAKRTGWRTYATTNGNTLAFPKFVGSALPWLDEVCISVHGPNAEVHDGATGDRGSFRLLDRALANIDASPARPYVLINFVVTPVNVAHVRATLEYVGRFKKVRHFLVSNLASEGGGKAHYRELAVPLLRLGAEAPGLARSAERLGLTLRFFGVPACALGPGLEKYANDFHWSPRATIERKRAADGTVGLVEIRGWTPTRGRAHSPRCEPCVYRGLCPGVFERYLAEFGDGEIRPIREGAPDPAFGRGESLAPDRETAFRPG